MPQEAVIDAVLSFWFGKLNEHGMCTSGQQRLWFKYSDATDRDIESRFGDRVADALTGELDHWQETSRGLVALVILLDQLTRNIFRGTPGAFSGDKQALALAGEAVASGRDRQLPAIFRVFLYIPYEHSEDLAVQTAGVELLKDLAENCDEAIRSEIEGYLDYAVAHRNVIERFGRFPHRNGVLGRASTPEEQTHLEQHGGF